MPSLFQRARNVARSATRSVGRRVRSLFTRKRHSLPPVLSIEDYVVRTPSPRTYAAAKSEFLNEQARLARLEKLHQPSPVFVRIEPRRNRNNSHLSAVLKRKLRAKINRALSTRSAHSIADLEAELEGL
jgi:hypothetical protein